MVDVRRWFLVSTVVITACATSASSSSIFYKTQADADAALAAFGQGNRSCQLWTNWQKMCSQTGENGSTYCAHSEQSVRPSVPFCVKYPDRTTETSLQTSSRLRFCTNVILNKGLVGSERIEFRDCNRYTSSRPFNGKRLSERIHPACKRWVMGGNIATRAEGSGDVLQCVEWASQPPCEMHDSVPRQYRTNLSPIVIPEYFSSNRAAVLGTYCADK